MNIPTVSHVHQLYTHNDYHYYPEMEKTIEEAIEHPENPIEIPDDFVSKTLERTNFFMEGVRKVKFFFQGLFAGTKCLFSPDYREKRELALNKIEIAYTKKVAEITRFANIIMLNKEPIEETKKLVTSLNNRLKVLKEEIVSEREKLEERIETKNAIVEEARALKEKKAYQPTLYERIYNYVASFNPYAKPEEDPSAHIKELDDSFPIDDLTEETLSAYQNETYEGSKLITAIKLGKISIEDKQKLIADEEKTLEAVRGMLKGAALNIQKAASEVERLNLTNYFEEEDLAVPDIAEEGAVSVAQKALTPQEKQLADIGKDIADRTKNKDLATLFTILLKRFPEEAVSNWQCDASGNFTLKLKETQHIWMPEKDPVGGAVLMLGTENGEIKGKLENNKVNFTSGTKTYVKGPFPMGYIDPTFDGIDFRSKTDVRIGGTYLGVQRWNQKTFSAVKKDWEANGAYIDKNFPGGYQKFLQDKVAIS